MDLGFSRKLERTGTDGAALAVADLTMTLAAQRAWQEQGPTARAFAHVLRGQDDGSDRIRALAQVFAPRAVCKWDTSCLAGSFNPLIPGSLTVGDTREGGVYRDALADVQSLGRI